MMTYDQISWSTKHKVSIMHLMKLLHETFQKALPTVHKVRLKSLIDATQALVLGNRLSLTGLGRNISNKRKPRSNIKRIDRLLGNEQLYKENTLYYQQMASQLVTKNSSPWIHIDWSCICATTKLYLLRASLSMSGRSVVLYQSCYTKTQENNHETHKSFLNQLKAILPSGVTPVIVTDAGFRSPWFAYVKHLGWDFVGRLRHKNLLQFDGQTTWQLSQTLHKCASSKPSYAGHAVLTERLQVPVNVILYRGKPKHRHRLNKNKSRSQESRSNRHARAHKEPWVLVTSIPPTAKTTQLVVKIYAQRMRIEEDFRDTKCVRYGFGLHMSRSRSTERMGVLLLIGAIATFACWLAALVTRESGQASAYQAHSSKFRSVLSSVYLGKEALRRRINIAKKQFNRALLTLFQMHTTTQLEVYPCT